MENTETAALEKWGFPLLELYRLALGFKKQNLGKAVHLSYADNLKLTAFKQQASLGSFKANDAPELGVLDVIGRDRQHYWQALGDMSREQAMEGFIDLLDNMCSAFRPYVQAVKQNRDDQLKADLQRMEEEKEAREKLEREQQDLLEEGYKEEIQRRQLQDALNKQTYQQFKSYAEKQFPGNPEQQAVLIHQLQQEHYHQYMQQLHMQNQNTTNSNNIVGTEQSGTSNGGQRNEDSEETLAGEQSEEPHQQDDDDDCVIIAPPKMWTRPNIDEFKAIASAGDGDGVINIGHGDTVTVRVPTNENGKCIFWEFATDNYDIGFGVFFEWSKPVSDEVTVHVSDSDDDDEFIDEDYLSPGDDLESGSSPTKEIVVNEMKPPTSIVVPIYRRECFNEVYVGSHVYPGEGIYLLKFDNSYSIWRSKTLYYRVYYER